MEAICVLTNKQNPKIEGFILFSMMKNNIMKIDINVKGLEPGYHGFHIHNKGNLLEGCRSLCSHFNPDNTQHGDRKNKKKDRHAGDLGNIFVNKKGVCKTTIYDHVIKLKGKYNIIGRSVVIHDKKDDLGLGGLDKNGIIQNKKIYLESIKTGNAGHRIACGVIGIY